MVCNTIRMELYCSYFVTQDVPAKHCNIVEHRIKNLQNFDRAPGNNLPLRHTVFLVAGAAATCGQSSTNQILLSYF